MSAVAPAVAPALQASRLSPAGHLRCAALGLAAGILASPVLAAAAPRAPAALALAGLLGALYGLGFRLPRGAFLDDAMTGATLGIPLWALVSVVAMPLLTRSAPAFSAAAMRARLPELVAFVLFGAALGLARRALEELAARWLGPAPRRPRPVEPRRRRVVVLGGGFAGVTVAGELERLLGADRSVEIVLVSETNALLFTPMLAEVAGSSLEPTHISSPLRTSLRRTQVLRAAVRAIDLEARRVALAGTPGLELAFDHLVLTLGSVTNHLGLEGLARHTLGFKSLRESMQIRNRVIDAFERAEVEPDAVRRRELLTFVVAGGGFAGVELAGALNDFARGMLADYPALRPEDVSVVLVHSGERILPELSPELAGYALERMRARGVVFRLGVRVADARPGAFALKSGEEVRGGTLVWTAGTAPHPLLKDLPVERSRRGAVVVDAQLRVAGRDDLWAAGDCAAVTDARTGEGCPPTAQFALREARVLARNLRAALRGKGGRPFAFEALGSLCVVGHHTACAELRVPLTRRRLRFSGLLAWLMWRGIYLAKLPGLERKVRVFSDWTLELFFPRDIVQTLDLAEPAPPASTQSSVR